MLRANSFLIFLIFIVLYTLAGFSYGAEEYHDLNPKGDTLTAVVTYGDKWLTRKAFDLDEKSLALLMDSLYSLNEIPTTVIKDLYFFYELRSKSNRELNLVLDSLFSMDTIPYALINEINLFLNNTEGYHMPSDFMLLPGDDSPYPANSLYQSWDTKRPNPYGRSLFLNDSSQTLLLKDDYWNCGFEMPIVGKITSRYGWREGKNHHGIDIDLEVWDPVRSVFPGMVRYVGYSGGYGRLVVIRHYNGLETYYAHLHRYKVKVGDQIETADIIGLGGSSGNSTGSHLHFEVRYKGIPFNPEHIISFNDEKLHADTVICSKNKYGYTVIPKGTVFYTIKRGDYLYKIAGEFGMSVNKLCYLNGISRNSVLRVGQKLRIKN
jgi:murein DD-endopeptidase MepM/ murein hydrolase activator NlpD